MPATRSHPYPLPYSDRSLALNVFEATLGNCQKQVADGFEFQGLVVSYTEKFSPDYFFDWFGLPTLCFGLFFMGWCWQSKLDCRWYPLIRRALLSILFVICTDASWHQLPQPWILQVIIQDTLCVPQLSFTSLLLSLIGGILSLRMFSGEARPARNVGLC